MNLLTRKYSGKKQKKQLTTCILKYTNGCAELASWLDYRSMHVIASDTIPQRIEMTLRVTSILHQRSTNLWWPHAPCPCVLIVQVLSIHLESGKISHCSRSSKVNLHTFKIHSHSNKNWMTYDSLLTPASSPSMLSQCTPTLTLKILSNRRSYHWRYSEKKSRLLSKHYNPMSEEEHYWC